MIKLTAISTVYTVSQVINVTENFQKRELVIDDSYTDQSGQYHPNLVCIEFVGDKMAMLDQIFPGQKVVVDAFVNGREKDGRYFTSLRGSKVAPYQPQQQAPQPQAPQQQPPLQAYQPQQSYGAQPFAQQQQPYQQQPYQQQPQYPGYTR